MSYDNYITDFEPFMLSDFSYVYADEILHFVHRIDNIQNSFDYHTDLSDELRS